MKPLDPLTVATVALHLEQFADRRTDEGMPLVGAMFRDAAAFLRGNLAEASRSPGNAGSGGSPPGGV